MSSIKRHFGKLRSRFKPSPQATAGASPAPSSSEHLSDGNQLPTKPRSGSNIANAPANPIPTEPSLSPFPKAASASAECTHATLPDRPVVVAAPTKTHNTADSFAKGPGTVVEGPAQQNPNASRNTALQKAIERHTANLNEHERLSCLKAFHALQETDLLERIKSCDQDHAGTSSFRQHADRLEGVFSVLDKFLKILSPNVSASPEATVAVGAIRAVLDIALNFLGFFGKLTSMTCRFGDFLAPLVEYSKIPQDETAMVDSLSAVYLDFLLFCQKARAVFVDEQGRTRKMSTFRVFWRVQWMPFETEFGIIEDDLRHHLKVLQHSSSAIAVSANLAVLAQQQVQGKENLLSWLSEFPYERRHEERYSKKHPGTGDWLIQHDKFQHWVQSRSSTLLWVHGGPGTGKSFLAANVLEYITFKKALDEDTGIAFVYYDHQVATQQDGNHAVRAMLKQLCRTRRVTPEHLLHAKQEALPVGSVDDLKAIAGAYRELFIVVDALDGCTQENRPEMIEILRDISQSLPLVRIFVTSRPEVDIIRVMKSGGTPTLKVDASFMAPDIKRFVTDEVQDLRLGRSGVRLCIKSDEVAEEVVRTLTERADGMFLWVRLQLQNLCRVSEARKDSLVRQALATLPKGLHDTYSRISNQIMEKPDYLRSLAIRTLQWVLYAQRPLYAGELLYALATFDDGQNAIDAELDDLDVVLGACANLVVQQTSNRGTFVRPAHYSVQEYFTGDHLPLHASIFHLSVGDGVQAHETLSAVCLAHFCQPVMFIGKCESTEYSGFRLTQDPFLHYAASYFDVHLYNLLTTAPKIACRRIDKFLASDPELFRSVLSTRAMEPDQWRTDRGALSRKLELEWELYALAVHTWTASSVVAATNLRLFPDIHLRYVCQEGNAMALHYACRMKNTPDINRFIAEGVDIECLDSKGRTPLCLAVLDCDEETALLFLENGASVKVQDHDGNSLLQMAVLTTRLDFAALADDSNFQICELLLDWDADFNIRCGHHGSALMAAAYAGNMVAIHRLVTAGADIHAVEDRTGSALHIASRNCDTEMVIYLLDNGADINLDGDTFGSPLTASLEGMIDHKVFETFTALVHRGARVDVQTLAKAAERCRVQEMASILLQLDDDDSGSRYSAIDIGVALVAVWTVSRQSTDPDDQKKAEDAASLLEMRLSASKDGMKITVGPDVFAPTFSFCANEDDWEADSETTTTMIIGEVL